MHLHQPFGKPQTRHCTAKTASPRDVDDLRSIFPNLIPGKLHCTDVPTEGLLTRFRRSAIKYRHLQLNGPSGFRWMPHDIDRADACFAHADANLPEPNFIAINPENGHAHSAFLLATPVACHAASRDAPLRLYAAVDRGCARRLGADRHYAGHIIKNPLHPYWRVEWRREQPYTLAELADWLFFKDMRPDPSIETTLGAGRNVTVFDELRQIAYREVLDFKRTGDVDAWQAHCLHRAIALNQRFPQPLGHSEVRAIVKSVAKWTWKNFSEQKFAQRQSQRGKRGNEKRWAGHVAVEKTKPWQAFGISRRTHYRYRKASVARNGTEFGTVAISDKPSLSALPAFALPVAVAPHRWAHLVRRDGFGRIPIDLPWAQPMRTIAAAVAAGEVPLGMRCSPSVRAAA